MKIRTPKKTDIVPKQLAELTYVVYEEYQMLSESISKNEFQNKIIERIATNCYDKVFVAEANGRIVGWLALYTFSDSKIAHIWNWHPVVLPGKNENKIANELIQTAIKHIQEIGSHKVTIDFQVRTNTQSSFKRYSDWYFQAGITEIIEEKYYKKKITDENYELSIPEEYSIGTIAETDLETLFECWEEIFSSSKDQFILSLNAEERRAFFNDSWKREKRVINEASLTLYHQGKLIGFSRFLPIYEPTDGYLTPIGILPEYRRKGLAYKLLEMSMQKLKELNYQTISFYVSVKNTPAISFYENHGFVSEHSVISLLGSIKNDTSGDL